MSVIDRLKQARTQLRAGEADGVVAERFGFDAASMRSLRLGVSMDGLAARIAAEEVEKAQAERARVRPTRVSAPSAVSPPPPGGRRTRARSVASVPVERQRALALLSGEAAPFDAKTEAALQKIKRKASAKKKPPVVLEHIALAQMAAEMILAGRVTHCPPGRAANALRASDLGRPGHAQTGRRRSEMQGEGGGRS